MLELIQELINWVKSWFVSEEPIPPHQNRQPLPPLVINQRQAESVSNLNIPKKKFEIQNRERKSFQVLEIRQINPQNRSASGRSFMGVMSRPRLCPQCHTSNANNSIKKRNNRWHCNECGYVW